MSPTYKNLHDQGRSLMEQALDAKGHGHDHAKKVLENSEKILIELQQAEPAKYKIIDIDNMMYTAAWWHDCYKRMFNKFSLYAIFNEGQEAEKIFIANEHSLMLPASELKQIAHAIRYHHQPWKFMFNWKGSPALTRILLEADVVESINIESFKHRSFRTSNIVIKLFYITLEIILITFYFLMPLTKAARKIYWENLGIK
jgi:hypothetical protein